MSITVHEKTLATDTEGYLINLDEWEPAVVDVMAKADNQELTEEHWEVIQFLRGFYGSYKMAPTMRILTREIGKKLGKEKGNIRYLYGLFPYDPRKQACRYAGLPKPSGCM
ncbi:tRNA 2-thiouridine synthesis protein TusE @ Sulfur redox associated protein DsrC [hydrothermal vent metagenome]|uniref:tRNA 2-thiouridine synthesis protein TusE @ Sulfur redox associated protein DsrC n=1 Tax=hydrothermal vent metagenome TaxID=652676 RepID=A0A3B1B1L9_9ZZZZ